jgi:hypothetical protein
MLQEHGELSEHLSIQLQELKSYSGAFRIAYVLRLAPVAQVPLNSSGASRATVDFRDVRRNRLFYVEQNPSSRYIVN